MRIGLDNTRLDRLRRSGGGPVPLPVVPWLDMDLDNEDSLTLDGSNRITQIADSQGGSRVGVGSTTGPQYVTDPTLGPAYINISQQFIRVNNFPLNYDTGYTIFIVHQLRALSSSTLYLIGTSSGNNVWARQENNSGPISMRVKHAGSGRYIGTTAMDLNPRLFLWRPGTTPRARYQGQENNQSNGSQNYGNQSLFFWAEYRRRICNKLLYEKNYSL